MDEQIFTLIKDGKISGFFSTPKMIETVISRVFVFDTENVVLKFYKRDNDWWNTDMQDLSGGVSRMNFIRQDFEFNRFLNPEVYSALKTAVIDGGVIKLVDPKKDDDELVIVMRKEDVSGTFTEILNENKLSLEDYKNIGKSFAKTKLAIPKSFLSENASNWYEQMVLRAKDLSAWVLSEKDFPGEVANKGSALFEKILKENQIKFEGIKRDGLFVLMDCNLENLIYSDRKLKFLDTYPPKDSWRIGTFDIDIFRVGSDIYALAGKDPYRAYLEGVTEVAGSHLDKNLEDFYLLYGALISAPYLFMLSKKDQKYKIKAEKYLLFVEKLVS